MEYGAKIDDGYPVISECNAIFEGHGAWLIIVEC